MHAKRRPLHALGSPEHKLRALFAGPAGLPTAHRRPSLDLAMFASGGAFVHSQLGEWSNDDRIHTLYRVHGQAAISRLRVLVPSPLVHFLHAQLVQRLQLISESHTFQINTPGIIFLAI